MIPVTKPFIPNRKTLSKYLDKVFDSRWLTNHGPMVQELTDKLSEKLKVDNLLLVANGTLALQIAYKAVGLRKGALTTPFSFPATTGSLVWEQLKPVFVDIEDKYYCLNPDNLHRVYEKNKNIDGIVPVHVYGNACQVEKIENFAQQYNLKTVYDGAHAMFSEYKGHALLGYGDAATFSLHATKIFHSVEGGGIVFRNKENFEIAQYMINFGLQDGHVNALGINAKMSEVHAATGLAVFDHLDEIFEKRANIWHTYKDRLSGYVEFQNYPAGCSKNYSYAPVVFRNESDLLKTNDALQKKNIQARRYFYPSLTEMPYIDGKGECPVSSDISKRVLCLPIYPDLAISDVDQICDIITSQMDKV